MADQDKIIDKIKKCLALSASSNEHEAEAALRQARKLMDAHGITDADMAAAGAEACKAKAGAKERPANWEAHLADKISQAFGCELVFTGGWFGPGHWIFIGCGSAPEVAQYAFTVLHRQAKRARAEHIKFRLKRCKVATKTRRADLFSEGWVRAVAGKIAAFAGNDQQTVAIAAYMAKHYPKLGDLAASDRNKDRRLQDHDFADYQMGRDSGKGAQLNRGVAGAEQQIALGRVA